MKAITEKQPWGYLICAGIKPIENRTWKTNFRGRVLIHAGRTKESVVKCLTEKQKEIVKSLNKWNEVVFPETSAIIGSVEIVDCVQNHPSIWAEKGVWNWVLANPVLFDKPIQNVKGKLGFWEYETICHICENFTNIVCEDCENYYCEDCGATYNQFTQIDYNCCKNCGESKNER